MPGVRLKGGNTDDYNLGRGIVYFEGEGILADGSKYEGGFRDLGNATEFNITIESETLEHQSSLEGLKTTDLEVLLSQNMAISLTLDEINVHNMALFFLGGFEGGDNRLGGGGANAMPNASAIDSGNALINDDHCLLEASSGSLHTAPDLWYDLFLDVIGIGKRRAYDFETQANQAIVVETSPNGTRVVGDTGHVTLVEGTDFTIDRKMGRIQFKLGTNYTANSRVLVSWPAPTVDKSLGATLGFDDLLSRVTALENSGATGALKFIAENPVDADHKTEYHFHQVTLKPDGDFATIGDEFTTLALTGSVEKVQSTPYGGSPFLDIVSRDSYST